MRAAVLKSPGRIVVEDIADLPVGPDAVVVEVLHCGICGSDIRYYQGENPWALHTLGRHVPNPPNIILGHEFVGRVVAAGGEEGRDLIGQTVVVIAYEKCGRCDDCLRGRHNLCRNMIHLGHGAGWGRREYYPGGMAERCPVWARRCLPLPTGLDPVHATMLDPMGVAVHATGLGHLGRLPDVAIIGCGPVGLSIAQIARAWGLGRALLFDVSRTVREVVGACGFEGIFDPAAEDPVTVVRRETNGRGVDAVWDTVGSEKSFAWAVDMLARQGVLVNLATRDLDVTFNLTKLGSERMIRTSSNCYLHDFATAASLLGGGRIHVEPLITHRVPLADLPAFLPKMLAKDDHQIFKAVVDVAPAGQ